MTSFHDLHDPIRHSSTNEEAILRGIVARFKEWLGTQDEDVAHLFCDHGAYKGAGKLRPGVCPFCDGDIT